jgi:hypothetical protein
MSERESTLLEYRSQEPESRSQKKEYKEFKEFKEFKEYKKPVA